MKEEKREDGKGEGEGCKGTDEDRRARKTKYGGDRGSKDGKVVMELKNL